MSAKIKLNHKLLKKKQSERRLDLPAQLDWSRIAQWRESFKKMNLVINTEGDKNNGN